MSDQVFRNAPVDKDGIPSKSWKDYFQARCVVLGSTQEQIGHADLLFETNILFAAKPDARYIVTDIIKLSEVCVLAGLVISKSEFRRKCQQKGILYNGAVIEQDVELNMNVPGCMHEVRLGKRFLEIVIPLKELKDETEES